MAKAKIHRKHFLLTAGAAVLGGLGLSRGRERDQSQPVTENSRDALVSRVEKDPRSVPQDPIS